MALARTPLSGLIAPWVSLTMSTAPPQLTPHMEPEGLRCLEEFVKNTQCFLEYGSGGSTVYVTKDLRVPVVISVESDKQWIERVRDALGATDGKLILDYCDLGQVGEWGNPVNQEKISEFWRYPALPWQRARQFALVPDTVLIDGRFRVASFLTSLVSARVGTKILFDDYFDRPSYFVAENFCQVVERRGRMAVFVTTRSFSTPEICEKIAQYSVLPNC